MIANLISIMKRSGGIPIVPVIQYIWNLISTNWEVRDTNWEEE